VSDVLELSPDEFTLPQVRSFLADHSGGELVMHPADAVRLTNDVLDVEGSGSYSDGMTGILLTRITSDGEKPTRLKVDVAQPERTATWKP
jgi:hypothetical protein